MIISILSNNLPNYMLQIPLNNPQFNEVLRKYSAFVNLQGGSNMTGTDLYVNKPQCAAAVRP